MCPISGCSSPWIVCPRSTAPPPMPVPIVRYSRLPTPRPAPQPHSASAAPLTSVPQPIGTPSAAPTAGARPVFPQSGLGVVVMSPQVGEPGRKSSGPNDAMPTAANGPRADCCRRKKSTARSIVSHGDVVGMRSSARRSSGPVPTAQTNLGAARFDPSEQSVHRGTLVAPT